MISGVQKEVIELGNLLHFVIIHNFFCLPRQTNKRTKNTIKEKKIHNETEL